LLEVLKHEHETIAHGLLGSGTAAFAFEEHEVIDRLRAGDGVDRRRGGMWRSRRCRVDVGLSEVELGRQELGSGCRVRPFHDHQAVDGIRAIGSSDIYLQA